MSSLRRRRSPSAASPLEDDDLLAEILLRLPPQPSSLPRASAVCQRWRLLVSDPRFLRRFRIHHRRNPPLLGFFIQNILPCIDLSFEPTLDPPNRAPVRRFSLQSDDDGVYLRILNCRHGLVFIFLRKLNQVLVWDPVIGNQHRIAVPPGFEMVRTTPMDGAVLRAEGDVHHFQVVLVGTYQEQHTRVVARVYSSETGLWSNVILTTLSPATVIARGMVCVLVGNSLYWSLSENSPGILELDLDRQSLTMIHVPVDIYDKDYRRFTVTRAEGGGLGFLFLSGFDVQLWNMKKDSDGVVSWVLRRTIELDKLLPLKPEMQPLMILSFAEHNNVLLLAMCIGVFIVQLESLQFKKFSETDLMARYHPFESVYTVETGSGGEHDGGGLLHNT